MAPMGNRFMNKKNCTCETTGTIIKTKLLTDAYFVTVEYSVGGEIYTITVQVRYKVKLKKIGFLPIGYSGKPSIGLTKVGSTVRVLYDPKKPKKAYLPDNVGWRV